MTKENKTTESTFLKDNPSEATIIRLLEKGEINQAMNLKRMSRYDWENLKTVEAMLKGYLYSIIRKDTGLPQARSFATLISKILVPSSVKGFWAILNQFSEL